MNGTNTIFITKFLHAVYTLHQIINTNWFIHYDSNNVPRFYFIYSQVGLISTFFNIEPSK